MVRSSAIRKGGAAAATAAFVWFTCAAEVAPSGRQTPILHTRSPTLRIIDDGDPLVSVLSKDVDPDTYVAHPSLKPRTVSYVTDSGRIDFRISPGERRDFAIRYQGRLYNQRLATIDPDAPRYGGAAAHPGGIDTIPFTLGPNNAIHVTGSINGSQPLDLIFDTGASLGVYGEGAAAKGARMRSGRHNTVRLGDVTVGNLPMVGIDYGGTSRSDGIVGFDALAGRVVTVDYDRRILTIGHDLPRVEGFIRVPITWRGQNALVPLTVATPSGAHRVMALFDTGSRWSLSLRNRDAAAAALRPLGSIGTHTGRKADGTKVVADVATLPWAEIGGLRLNDVQVDVERPGADTALPHNILGNDFLKRFNVIVDYRASEIYLKPNHLVGSPYNRVFPTRYLVTGGVLAAIGALGALLWRRRRRIRHSPKQPQR